MVSMDCHNKDAFGGKVFTYLMGGTFAFGKNYDLFFVAIVNELLKHHRFIVLRYKISNLFCTFGNTDMWMFPIGV